jgi:hypothetical protein
MSGRWRESQAVIFHRQGEAVIVMRQIHGYFRCFAVPDSIGDSLLSNPIQIYRCRGVLD